jgi:polysaccharide biosynthesis transport protein
MDKNEIVLRPPEYQEVPATMMPGLIPTAGLLDLWHIIRRRKKLLLLLAFLGGVLGFLLTLPQTPVYQSVSRIEIQSLNDNLMNTRQSEATVENINDVERHIQTEIKVLQSDSLIGSVIEKLKLDQSPESLEQPGRLTVWRRAMGLKDTASTSSLDQMIKAAAENLKVQSLKGTSIVELTCDSTNPKLAANFLNTLNAEFSDRSMRSRWDNAQRTGDWLNHQLEDMRIKLEKSEDALQTVARASGLLFTGENKSVAEDKLGQLQEELSKAQAERISKQSRYEIAKSSTPESLPEVMDASSLNDYRSKLTELQRQAAELDGSLTANHPKFQRVQAQIVLIQQTLEFERNNILRRIGNELESARRREKLLQTEYTTQASLVSEQASKGIQYGILKREVDTNRQIYEAMLQKVKEYSIASAIRASNVIVVDPAKAPLLPYKPNIFRYSLLGLFLGLGAGVVLVFSLNQADRSIQQPGDTALYLDVRELGVIPSAKVDPGLRDAMKQLSDRSLKKGKDAKLAVLLEENHGNGNGNGNGNGHKTEIVPQTVELATLQRKYSLLAEAYRATLASILFTGQNGSRPRVILVSSPSPEEGKTSSVTNLGIALAEINRRVVLIDADMRRPRLHEVFEIDNSQGLCDLLREKQSIEEYPIEALVKETRVPNLYLLPSGPSGLSIANLLYSPRLVELIKRFRNDFDAVIIDTPPMLQISDARVMGGLSDGIILVLRAGRTSRDTALAATRRFEEDGTRIIGTILNCWDPKKSSHNGYYSKYYYEGKYSGYYSPKEKSV